MAFIYFSNNPRGKIANDCVVRAISKVTGAGWENVYINLCALGLKDGDMPSSNAVWSKHLRDIGYRKHMIPDTCPDCYTINDFCRDNPVGEFILGTGSHAVAVIDGDFYDAWPSGDEIPQFYFQKEEY